MEFHVYLVTSSPAQKNALLEPASSSESQRPPRLPKYRGLQMPRGRALGSVLVLVLVECTEHSQDRVPCGSLIPVDLPGK